MKVLKQHLRLEPTRSLPQRHLVERVDYSLTQNTKPKVTQKLIECVVPPFTVITQLIGKIIELGKQDSAGEFNNMLQLWWEGCRQQH